MWVPSMAPTQPSSPKRSTYVACEDISSSSVGRRICLSTKAFTIAVATSSQTPPTPLSQKSNMSAITLSLTPLPTRVRYIANFSSALRNSFVRPTARLRTQHTHACIVTVADRKQSRDSFSATAKRRCANAIRARDYRTCCTRRPFGSRQR